MPQPVAISAAGNCPLSCATWAAGRFAPPAPSQLSVGSVSPMRFAASSRSADCVGTPRKRVTPSRLITRTASSASHLCSSEILAPAGRLSKNSGCVAVTWNSGVTINPDGRGAGGAPGSGGVTSGTATACNSQLNTALSAPRWVWTTPFGLPVVPEEYITAKSSSVSRSTPSGAVSAIPCITADSLCGPMSSPSRTPIRRSPRSSTSGIIRSKRGPSANTVLAPLSCSA